MTRAPGRGRDEAAAQDGPPHAAHPARHTSAFVVRAYAEAGDLDALVELFTTTVHAVCARDYTPEQLHAWAPRPPLVDFWRARLSTGRVRVAVAEDGRRLGFARLEGDDFDMLYVAAEAQGRGVGGALFDDLRRHARALGQTRWTTHASHTARPFFERRGFTVIEECRHVVRGVALSNWSMEAAL